MKNKKNIIWIIAIVVVVILGYKYTKDLSDIELKDSNEPVEIPAQWSEIIADSVNESGISLMVDGKKLEMDKEDIIMDESKNVFISSDVVTDAFSCAINTKDTKNITIHKSNTKVTLCADKNGVVVDDYLVNTGEVAIVEDSRCYIPLSVFYNYFAYDYKWNYDVNNAELTNQKPDEKIYPIAYDYRVNGRVTAVKDQADLGTCWAFAALKAMETTFLPGESYNFSEDHMSFHNGYNMSQAEGGKFNMSMAYLLSWKGPVYEEQDPYGDGMSPDGLESVFHVQEIQIIDNKDLDAIKRAVFLTGGVQSSIYMPTNYKYQENSAWYNATNHAYYYVGSEKANHDVVIVGWDDSYPAANFSTEPEADGAFICINSWGEEFGDKGFFYVSYYDSGIGVHNFLYTSIEDTNNYDNIYQSDMCGWIGQLGYGREYGYFANVYKTAGNEVLEAVGFYATGKGTTYEVYVVDSFTGEEDLVNRRKVAEGSLANAGYYTISLDEKVFMPAGNKFAVIVYINTPSAKQPIAIEYVSGVSTDTVDITDGEGYISLHGGLWERVEDTQECNICLKAYTRKTETAKGN